jgi:dipeptidyl aminopeptidase/acylaminoacyl peptidase
VACAACRSRFAAPHHHNPSAPLRSAFPFLGAGLLLALSGAILWILFRSSTAAAPPTPVPLTTYLGDEGARSFSPDETRIAYSWNGERQDNFDIYAEAIGSGRRVRLTTDPAADSSPVWSPDGRSIAFIRGTALAVPGFRLPNHDNAQP